MPIAESYRLLLKDTRFDYTTFKDTTNKYKHHYSTYI